MGNRNNIILPVITAFMATFFSSSSIASFSSFDRHKLEIENKPEFKSIKRADEKKQAFIDYFYPIIVNNNIELLKKRELVKKSKNGNDVLDLCDRYSEDCKSPKYKQRLLSKLDIILPSIAIAQGALESGWGSSKYAVKGNNFFGIYCYSPKCGILNKKGANPKKYKNPLDSISDYFFTINNHQAYKKLRTIRTSSKSADDWYSGLKKYSIKSSYPRMVNKIVSDNDLKDVDLKMLDYLSDKKIYMVKSADRAR